MKPITFLFGVLLLSAAIAVDISVDIEGPLGQDQQLNFIELVAIHNVRNKLSDSVRELVRFYEEDETLTVEQYVQKYVDCDQFIDARFFIVNTGEERFSASNCSEWISLFTMLRVNQVYLGDYLTNSAVYVLESFGGLPKLIQTRSEVFVIGQYENVTESCSPTVRQLTPTYKTFVHKAQVTINWRRDGNILTGEWKIVQFRQLLFQRWRWDGFWSDEQFLFSGGPVIPC